MGRDIYRADGGVGVGLKGHWGDNCCVVHLLPSRTTDAKKRHGHVDDFGKGTYHVDVFCFGFDAMWNHFSFISGAKSNYFGPLCRSCEQCCSSGEEGVLAAGEAEEVAAVASTVKLMRSRLRRMSEKE